MTHARQVGLVLVGLVVGCGAAAVAPMATTWAQPRVGEWDCFVVDRFPDVGDARSWDGAANIRYGLNHVARHVPPGTVLSVTPKSGSHNYASVACVKY